MNKYEIMFIVKSTLEEAAVKKTADDFQKIFSGSDSKVVDFKDMGLKKLAYPISKEINGYYFLLNVESNVKAIDDFKHKISINEDILRYLIVKLDEE